MPAPLRPLTRAESFRLLLLAGRLAAIDADLAALVARVAGGDDDALPALHDRFLVIGRPELADRLRALVGR